MPITKSGVRRGSQTTINHVRDTQLTGPAAAAGTMMGGELPMTGSLLHGFHSDASPAALDMLFMLLPVLLAAALVFGPRLLAHLRGPVEESEPAPDQRGDEPI